MGELHAGDAGAHEQVQVVQGAGAHAHQDLVGLEAGFGGVFIDQHFRSAVLVDASGFHL